MVEYRLMSSNSLYEASASYLFSRMLPTLTFCSGCMSRTMPVTTTTAENKARYESAMRPYSIYMQTASKQIWTNAR